LDRLTALGTFLRHYYKLILLLHISYDIYTAAKITAAQLSSYNPGLDCSKIQIGMLHCDTLVNLDTGARFRPKVVYLFWDASLQRS
jgi:hypothetical protein